MLRSMVLALCALACSTAAARGVVARGEVHAAPRAEAADGYRRDGAVAPVTRYRARQDVANSGYLGAAMDGDDSGGDDGYANGNDNGNGGNNGGNPYQGDGGTSFGTFTSSAGTGSLDPGGAVSYTGTYKASGIESAGCVYKGVMSAAAIARCKTASEAEMARHGVK